LGSPFALVPAFVSEFGSRWDSVSIKMYRKVNFPENFFSNVPGLTRLTLISLAYFPYFEKNRVGL
jgi:hypothetical protein